MGKVELREIRNFVCQGTNLEILPGELLVLLGPNGAGKTTLLNVIAGLISYRGHVLFDGEKVDGVPARDRKVGYVFQDLVLFPHLSAGRNIAYGLQTAGWARDEQDKRVDELLDLFKIAHLRSRYPATLSGGEKQRVALARALAPRPRLLLLDEPFNSLDLQTTGFLRTELKQHQREFAMTTLFVTHDLNEAELLADRIAVMLDGRIEQIGKPNDILFCPRGEKILEFIGTPNILECDSVRHVTNGLLEARCNGLNLLVAHNGEAFDRISILPRDVVVLSHKPNNSVNVFTGRLREIIACAGTSRVIVETAGCRLVAELPKEHAQTGLGRDSEVFVELALTKLRPSYTERL
ncbi:MAG: ABC transporter ATP-binding protein [Deltaproteobacteria bacterium]|nr:ABC transporter ATP-binding protein [Deltaproteobacteria bacterium]